MRLHLLNAFLSGEPCRHCRPGIVLGLRVYRRLRLFYLLAGLLYSYFFGRVAIDLLISILTFFDETAHIVGGINCAT